MLVFVTPPGREKKPQACLPFAGVMTLSSKVGTGKYTQPCSDERPRKGPMHSSTPLPLVRTYLSIARRKSRFIAVNAMNGISLILAIIGFSTQTLALEIISIAGLATGCVAIAATFASWRREVDDLRVQYLPPLAARDISNLMVPPRLGGSGYDILHRGDKPADALLTSARVNQALFRGGTAPVRTAESTFHFRPSPAVAHVLLREFTRKAPVLFNARKVRLTSDPVLDEHSALGPVSVQPTHYFDTLVTNDSLPVRLASHRSRTEVFNGNDLCFPGRTVPACQESACSNHIGASTIALTADDYLVIVEQGYRSNIASGLLMPSGSGSADWKDLDGTQDLREFVSRVATRELQEECGLGSADIGWLRVLGYGRLLARGGLPQFFCLARLNCSFRDIQVTRSERALTECHLPVDVGGDGSRYAAIQSAITDLRRDGHRLFSSLWWALELLARLPEADVEDAFASAAPPALR